MEFPTLYFTMDDGTKLRATFRVSGFDYVRVDIAEQVGRWIFRKWVIKSHPTAGYPERLMDFCGYSAERVSRWAKKEAVAWHEYAKVLKAYKP